MDKWFSNVAKTTLSEAFETACDEVDRKFAAALAAEVHAKGTATVTAELEALRASAAQVERLQQENASLQKQLLDLKSVSAPRLSSPRKLSAQHDRATSATPLASVVRTPLASKSTNDSISTHKSELKHLPKPRTVDASILPLSELRTEFSRIQDDYKRLYNKCTAAENARAEMERKLRIRTKQVDDWKEQWHNLEEKHIDRGKRIKTLRQKLAAATGSPQPGFSRGPSLPPGNLRNGMSELQVSNADNSSDRTTSSGDYEEQELRDRTVDRVDDHDDNDQALPPMLDHEDRTPLPAARVKMEPSSDPIVISEKIVRKRKLPGDDDGPDPAKTKIKEEPASDPVSIDSDKFTAHESLDLDADGQLIQTPKKHRQVQLDISLLHDSESKGGESNKGNFEGRVRASGPAVEHSTEGNSIDSSSALHPLSSNILRKRTSPLDVSGARFRKRRSAPGVATLAEDGELYDNEQGRNSTSHEKPSGSLLHNLLHSNTPNREAIIPPGARQTSDSTPTPQIRTANPKAYQFPVPEKRPLPFGDKTPRAAQTLPPTTQSLGFASPRVRRAPAASARKAGSEKPRQGPSLRGRPLSELKLSDFKVNPAANDGFDYAYTDIVRSREERSKLPGDLSVYGEEFRAQARAQRHSTSDLAFTSLLENWLGDNAYMLSDMSAADKETLWEEAKTAELANKCGRVKHRYPRQRSPPGAWRTDFPDTQEEKEYKEQAHKLDRQIVAERYREATRPGGTWLFRDE